MKNPLALLLALLSVFSISFGLESTRSSVECEYECMPLHNFTIERTLEAEGDWEFIYEIELREDVNVLCTKDVSINISGGDSERVTSCEAQIPEMDEGDWDIKSCYIFDTANESGIEQCFSETVEVEHWRCEENADCDDDEYCNYNDCDRVECDYCEYVYNHGCKPYECCSDSDCDSDEKCFEHECVRVQCTRDSECGPMEVCRGYRCDEVECKDSSPCEDDQFCSIPEYDCIELECERGMVAYNHTCIEPGCLRDSDCPGTSVCTDYDCVPVECPDGVVREHVCIPYECHNDSDCEDYEGCRGGFCEALECTEGRVPAFHQCSECASDADCPETEYCPAGTCVPVSCPGGEVFSHICIPPEPVSEPEVTEAPEEEPSAPREKPLCPSWVPLAFVAIACFALAQGKG